MTFFINFGKKARVYYTLSISRGGGPGPRAPPPGFATGIGIKFLWAWAFGILPDILYEFTAIVTEYSVLN